MIIHHFVTISLIASSYLFGYHRIGLMVLYCHNVNDIFLEGAKCFRSIGATKTSNVTFVLLIVSWIYSRLYLFPFYVIRSAMLDTFKLASRSNLLIFTHYVSNMFLLSLLAMHIYWFYLICRIAVNAVKNGEAKDERED
jgi:ceramide synthetase